MPGGNINGFPSGGRSFIPSSRIPLQRVRDLLLFLRLLPGRHPEPAQGARDLSPVKPGRGILPGLPTTGFLFMSATEPQVAAATTPLASPAVAGENPSARSFHTSGDLSQCCGAPGRRGDDPVSPLTLCERPPP